MLIRRAIQADVESLRNLRNHYVASYATFDETPLSTETVGQWVASFGATGPYQLLVAEHLSSVVGFASSQQYRAHPAFRLTVETSIYTAAHQAGSGVGSRLYAALFEALSTEAIHSAVVGIALPNDASVRLHKKFGFSEVGVFREYAVKHSQFISSLWMQRLF